MVALAAKMLLVVGTLSAIAWVWWADEGAAWWRDEGREALAYFFNPEGDV